MSNLARDAIATLLELAQRGEIDPWDVRVIEVVDRYLSKLSPVEERDPLPESGQAFLWASMLVLLKANTLEQSEQDAEDPESEELEVLEVEGRKRALPVHLERHIRRRPAAPPTRRRRVTLAELIEQIQEMAVVLESTASHAPKTRALRIARKETARSIAQLAHDENLTEVASQLEHFLVLHLPGLLPSSSGVARERPFVELDRLLEWWHQANDEGESSQLAAQRPPSKDKDRVGIFWALLLLSAQSKVELVQEEFYQDLKIRPLDALPLVE
ncbi:MAG: segregation/condensation protein A [Cyanobacteriota bacterium]|nr:segregation/condensation protein A [Cyanobacteriota bacterium]